MLSEIRLIGEYALDKVYKDNPTAAFITFVDADKILPIKWNWENFYLDKENVLEDVSQESLVKILFNSPLGNEKPVFPNFSTNEKFNSESFKKKLKSIIQKLVNTEIYYFKLFRKFKLTDKILDDIKQYIEEYVDKNSKIIITFKISKTLLSQFGLTPETDDDFVFWWEIKEFKQYFVDILTGKFAKTTQWFCHICEQQKSNIINFAESRWVNFPFKFFTLDKPWFAPSLEPKKYWSKLFGICQNCFRYIKAAENIWERKFKKFTLGEYAYIFPSFLFYEDKNLIFEILDILTEEKVYNKFLEDKLKNNLISKYNDNMPSNEDELLESLFEIDNIQDKIDNAKFILQTFRLHFLFANKNQNEFKIKYFLKDVIPSRFKNLFKTISIYEWEKLYRLAQDFFNVNYWRFKNSISKLKFFPSKEKEDNYFTTRSIKRFFVWDETKKINNKIVFIHEKRWYQFLDKILHWQKIFSRWIWDLVLEKLKNDFKKYFKSSEYKQLDLNLRKWYFTLELWNLYLTLIWLLENDYLDINFSKMIDFSQFNFKVYGDSFKEKFERLKEYFETNRLIENVEDVYPALIWLYVGLLIKVQKKNLGNAPFIEEINLEKLDYERLEKLLFKARDKFNKYWWRKFEYWPDLYRFILDLKSKIKWNLSNQKLAYLFSLGMELLPNIWYGWKDEKKE